MAGVDCKKYTLNVFLLHTSVLGRGHAYQWMQRAPSCVQHVQKMDVTVCSKLGQTKVVEYCLKHLSLPKYYIKWTSLFCH